MDRDIVGHFIARGGWVEGAFLQGGGGGRGRGRKSLSAMNTVGLLPIGELWRSWDLVWPARVSPVYYEKGTFSKKLDDPDLDAK